jgi:hypothetical protein
VTHPLCDQLWASGTTQPVPSDTSDEQWALIEPLLPEVKTGGRPEKHPRRALVDAILYVVRTGCAWRQLRPARRTIIVGSLMMWCLVVDRAAGISQRHRRLMAPGRRRSG